MSYVYILRSLKYPNRIYIGHTSDLKKRLANHNSKKTKYSKRFAPWKIETYIAFSDKNIARNFEGYLKKGSGNAFLKKRLINIS